MGLFCGDLQQIFTVFKGGWSVDQNGGRITKIDTRVELLNLCTSMGLEQTIRSVTATAFN